MGEGLIEVIFILVAGFVAVVVIGGISCMFAWVFVKLFRMDEGFNRDWDRILKPPKR